MTDYESTPLDQLRVLRERLVQRKTRMGRSLAHFQRMLRRGEDLPPAEQPSPPQDAPKAAEDIQHLAASAIEQMAFGALSAEDVLTLSRQKRRLASLLAQRAEKVGQHCSAVAQTERLERELHYLAEETARLVAHIEAQEHAMSQGSEKVRVLMSQVAQSPKTLAARLKSAARAELEANCCRAIAEMVELDQELHALMVALRAKETHP
jgi:hypothetical protein